MFEEKEVVSRIISGDMKAFALLVTQYQALVFHVAYRLIDNTQDAEDVSQETFIRVHKGLHLFAFQSKLSTWIASIAYHTSVNYLKKNNAGKLIDDPGAMEPFLLSASRPDEELTRKNSAAFVRSLVELLPPVYKTLVTLYHLHEFSYGEIQEITGLPEGTIKSYLFRARKMMKEHLDNHLKEEL